MPGERVSNRELKEKLDELTSKVGYTLVGPDGLAAEISAIKSEIKDIRRVLGGLLADIREVAELCESLFYKVEKLEDGPSATQRCNNDPCGTPPLASPDPHESPATSCRVLSPWEPPSLASRGPCRHGPLNNLQFNRSVETKYGNRISSKDGINAWTSSLGSTLLGYHSQTCRKLDAMVKKYFDTYEIHWNNNKSHRMFTIMCRECGGASTGNWAHYQQLANAPGATQKVKEDGECAVEALHALQHFVNYVPQDALPPPHPTEPEMDVEV